MRRSSTKLRTAVTVDVSREEDIRRLVQETLGQFGRIDLFCSNAGIALGDGVETPDADWRRIWEVNFMAHVYAARAVLPHMLDRGEGYLLQTASAAGLLTQIGSAPYSVTKHAAVALAEAMVGRRVLLEVEKGKASYPKNSDVAKLHAHGLWATMQQD